MMEIDLDLKERSHLCSLAVEAAKRGGEVLSQHFRKVRPHEIHEKFLNDFVTTIDLESEAVIQEFLRKETPEMGFLGEETGTSGQASATVWVVDPLDGTKNYIHGFPFFAVSIALLHKGTPIVGVILAPMRQDLFYGYQGGGAFRNGERIRVSRPTSLRGTLIATGFPFRSKDHLPAYLQAFREVFLRASGVRRAGSAALDLAYTAMGVFDGFFEFGLSIWDIAAGTLLIQEAGGTVHDFLGGEQYLQTGNIIAGSPRVVEELIPIIREAFGDQP